jgi:EmrB/QacA subfamily drug resistance transporter
MPTAPSTATAPTVSANAPIDPELRRMAAAIITGAITVILDTTIVSVGLDRLGQALQASVATIQWVSTAYLLAMFVSIPLSGWLQSRLGSKRLWLASLTVFLLGSMLCALAWNAPSLIAFRALQGLGGGVMMPLMATILMQAAHGRNLGRLMAAVSLPAAVGPILGPVIGGLILNDLSWRWLFLVNLPIGAVGLALAVRLIPSGERGRRVPLDLVGLLLLSPGVVGVIFGLSRVGDAGGFAHAGVLAPLLAGVALVAGFVAWALPRGQRALVDLQLFRNRALTMSSLLMFLTGVALYGAMLLLPLYWQQVRGESALGAGLLLAPQGVGALASRTVAGRLTDSIGGRWVAVVGFALMTVATVPFALATSTTSTWWLMGVLVVRGLAVGAVFIPLMTGAYLGLERSQVPDASIVTRIAQQLGGSFGVAVLAVILVNATAASQGANRLSVGFDHAFWWATGFTAVATVLSLLLPKRPSANLGAGPS